MSKTYTLNEAIQYFKDNKKESFSSIEPLIDDTQLRSAFIAWQSVSMQKIDNHSDSIEYTSDLEMWNWIWKQFNVDLKTLSIVSGIKEVDVTQIFHRLIGLRLIYPYQEVHSFASQYVDSLIAKKIQMKRK